MSGFPGELHDKLSKFTGCITKVSVVKVMNGASFLEENNCK